MRSEEKPPRLDTKTPIKSAVLAVLLEGPGHGYDVWKRVTRHMGSWDLDSKHIYEPLKQLERAGLVWSRQKPIPEPPGFRRIYFATEAAKQAREVWFGSPPATSALRADIHVRVAFSKEEDGPDLLRALGEYRADLLEVVEQDERMSWAAQRGSWAEFSLGSLRNRKDKQHRGEIEWINEFSEEIREKIAKRRKS